MNILKKITLAFLAIGNFVLLMFDFIPNPYFLVILSALYSENESREMNMCHGSWLALSSMFSRGNNEYCCFQIRVIDVVKYRKIHEEVMKKLDKLENEFLPQVMVDTTEVIFDTLKFLEMSKKELIIANTGQVRVMLNSRY